MAFSALNTNYRNIEMKICQTKTNTIIVNARNVLDIILLPLLKKSRRPFILHCFWSCVNLVASNKRRIYVRNKKYHVCTFVWTRAL